MASLGTKTQDPSDNLDYSISYSSYLLGDEIVSSVWTVPAGINKSNEVFSENTVSVFLRGGTAGQTYEITNTITSALGRIIERSFILAITNL